MAGTGDYGQKYFFRHAALAICSSLDSEIALHRCFEFLSHHIPLDLIQMNYYDPQTRRINYLAEAYTRGGRRLGISMEMPQNAIRILDNEVEEVFITNSQGIREIDDMKRKVFNFQDVSILTLLLQSEKHLLGAIDFLAMGTDKYTSEHAERILMLKKPFNISMSNSLRYIELSKLKDRLTDDNRYLSNELMLQAGSEIVGANNGLRHVMEQVDQVAHLNSTVLIRGETGVGKELIANAIHNLSPRRGKPFIKINCGAIPESLLDSELFGHEKGAFTGAVTRKRGRFERANTGTIFLDEMGELPPEAQVRLLRVLQNREIERVGGTSVIPVDIRVICATHQNIEERIQKGLFREALWFRINTFPIYVPPLRERKEDIPELINYFLNRRSHDMGIKTYSTLPTAALDRLTTYNWPGNVRELENVIERELIQNRTGTLLFNDINQTVKPRRGVRDSAAASKDATLDEIITRHIQGTLARTEGKVHGPDGAARILNINPHTLSKRMNKLGIVYGRKYKKQLQQV